MTNKISEPMRKLGETILLALELSGDDPLLGRTKLAKLLFYADFAHFLAHGASITGQPYRRLPRGPVPEAYFSALKGLKKTDAIRSRPSPTNPNLEGHVHRRSADRSMFTDAEIATVSEIVTEFRTHNATELSDLSHRFIGWEVFRNNERIPYETAYYCSEPPPPDAHAEIARQIAEYEAHGR